jgi:hypothetical protein
MAYYSTVATANLINKITVRSLRQTAMDQMQATISDFVLIMSMKIALDM